MRRAAAGAALLFAGCFSEVRPAPPEVARLRLAVAREVEMSGSDLDAALRDGLDRDLRDALARALDAAGFAVVDDPRAPRDFIAQVSVSLESHRIWKGTVGTASLVLHDAAGASADAVFARIDAQTYSASAFADRAAAALATALGRSARLAEIARRIPR